MTGKHNAVIDIPEFNSQEKLTTQTLIYQRLRHALMIGSIPPGIALTIRGLAERLGVSPTPIRESLRRLSAEGALHVLDNRRVMTPDMTLERFDALITLRQILECHAARAALPYINEQKTDELWGMNETIDQHIQAKEYEQIVLHNQRFHTLWYTANPHQVVMPSIESIWLQLGPYNRVALAQSAANCTADDHKLILQALCHRDEAAMLAALQQDIQHGSEIIRATLLN